MSESNSLIIVWPSLQDVALSFELHQIWHMAQFQLQFDLDCKSGVFCHSLPSSDWFILSPLKVNNPDRQIWKIPRILPDLMFGLISGWECRRVSSKRRWNNRGFFLHWQVKMSPVQPFTSPLSVWSLLLGAFQRNEHEDGGEVDSLDGPQGGGILYNTAGELLLHTIRE